LPPSRVAITTDWLTSFGGAERVLEELRRVYPGAPIFTSVFKAAQLPPALRDWDVRPTYLQRFPLVKHYSRALLPLMPGAFRRLDLDAFDTVITVASAFSKNVKVRGGARNICYCLTPPRYLWDLQDQYLTGPVQRLAAPVVRRLREADLRAAQGVDEFFAISQTVADRIRRTYEREARVIFPPVDTLRVRPNGRPPEDFYLVVSRLVPYKRVDLAVDACTKLGRKLIVVGSGPEVTRLKTRAGSSITFAGSLDDAAVADLYARSQAFIFPGLEDFGITPVEAQSAGRPVVAYGVGGAAETVVDGITGVFFHEQTVDAIVAAIEQFERTAIDPRACRANAERFDSSVFRDQMRRLVSSE
jgi:glycosyltransferase involved in cell wall biosynthesis